MKITIIIWSLFVQVVFCLTASGAYNATVDKNYSGANGASVGGTKMYATIAAAIADVPSSNTSAYTVYIKNGKYVEHITLDKPFVAFIGQNMDSTVLSYGLAQGSANGASTWGADCATLKIIASNFTAVNMTIENSFDYLSNMVKDTANPTYIKSAQALAVRTANGSGKAFFKSCKISGYQDPLFAELGTQYYKQCTIQGVVDFIYGGGQAAFDSCDIICRSRPGKNPMGYITASSTQSAQAFGLVFFSCSLRKEIASIPAGSYSLGRPWHPSADPNAVGMSVFINCWMDGMIKTIGWDSMSSTNAAGTKVWFVPYKTSDSRFYEYKSTGPGAVTVANPPYRKFLTDTEAATYTITKVLGGWVPDDVVAVVHPAGSIAVSPPRVEIEKINGVLYLKIPAIENIRSLSVFSLDGRKIKTFSTSSPGLAGIRLELDASSSAFGKGVYFVRLLSGKQTYEFKCPAIE
jgi:pectinesterase